MSKVCDHTSVGILVWQDKKLLLIERKRFPFGFAPPAGHLDGDSFGEAAKRELKEEVGLNALSLKLLLKEKKDNKCRRDGGNFHNWEIFEAKTQGEIKPSPDETKSAGFYDLDFVKRLAQRTNDYDQGKISDGEWKKNPGLEKAFLDHAEELKII